MLYLIDIFNRVMFQKVETFLFLPLYLAGGCGIVFLILERTKPHRRAWKYYAVGIVGAMFLWRLLMNIESSRYAAALFIPMLLLAVFAFRRIFYFIATVCRRKHLRCPLYLCFVALILLYMVPFLVKSFRVDWVARNREATFYAMRDAVTAAGDRTLVLCSMKNSRRLGYYTGLTDFVLLPEYSWGETDLAKVQFFFNSYRYSGLDIYAFLSLDMKEWNSTPAPLGEMIFMRDASTKQPDSKFAVLRYRTVAPLQKLPPGGEPPPERSGNLILNGGFEQSASPEVLRRYLDKIPAGQAVAYSDARFDYPAHWDFQVYATRDEPYPLQYLSGEDAISGDKSFFMENNGTVPLFATHQLYKSGSYNVSFMAMGEKGVRIACRIIFFDPEQKKWATQVQYIFILPETGIFQIDFPITASEKHELFNLVFSLPEAGQSVKLDEVGLYPAANQ